MILWVMLTIYIYKPSTIFKLMRNQPKIIETVVSIRNSCVHMGRPTVSQMKVGPKRNIGRLDHKNQKNGCLERWKLHYRLHQMWPCLQIYIMQWSAENHFKLNSRHLHLQEWMYKNWYIYIIQWLRRGFGEPVYHSESTLIITRGYPSCFRER